MAAPSPHVSNGRGVSGEQEILTYETFAFKCLPLLGYLREKTLDLLPFQTACHATQEGNRTQP